MSNIKLRKEDIIKLHEEFIQDVEIKAFNDIIIKTYETSIPIGVSKDGHFIYHQKTEAFISEIRKQMDDYIKTRYGGLNYA